MMVQARWEAAIVPHPDRLDSDSGRAWQLDSSLAVVLPTPASIHSPNRRDPIARWEALIAAFEHDLVAAARATPGLEAVNPHREHYRTMLPTGQGGGLGDLTELLTLVQDAHAVVDGLSGWLALADFARTIPTIWKQVRLRRHEHDELGQWPTLPLLSVPLLKALCIQDLVARYGERDVPAIAIDTRPAGAGGKRHPTAEVHHILTAVTGTELVQRFVWLATSHGVCYEHFVILDGPPLELHALSLPEWISPHMESAW